MGCMDMAQHAGGVCCRAVAAVLTEPLPMAALQPRWGVVLSTARSECSCGSNEVHLWRLSMAATAAGMRARGCDPSCKVTN